VSVRLAVGGALLALPLALAACGGSGDASQGSAGSRSARSVSVTITDAGCEPARLELPSGPVTFEVRNDGADRVTEFEVLDGDRIRGEAENVAPGLSGSFSLTLTPGTYATYCPGGSTSERGTLVVTGAGSGGGSAAARAAVARYRGYLEAQTAELVASTARFVAALKAGDVARAKTLYGPARAPWERVEPVAESFRGLDPAIDARAGDVQDAEWTGFHPLERALWVRGSAAGTASLADRLLGDVSRLRRLVRTVELEPAQIANGAVELLGEVSKSKVTGEEERYSHLDLVDLEANVDGANAAYGAVRPIVAGADTRLARTIDRRFEAVARALAKHRQGSSFVSYRALTSSDTRALSRAVDALAEPLSHVAAIVVSRS
jgi:iron uptake system component EfeO